MPSLGNPGGPGQGNSFIAHLVNTPIAPMLPWPAMIKPLRPGPGPSSQNQPNPEPRDPDLKISPVGVTHSKASRFSRVSPPNKAKGDGPPLEQALARGEQLEPAPIIVAFRP